MCSQPLKILSRKADKVAVFDSLSYVVPCGHCEECKKNKRLSWYVRLYYQWLECEKNGGFSLFITLTYNNKNIPTYEGYNCFDSTLIQKFFKRFRSRLSRKYPNTDWNSVIKYACFSEYGGKTHRPHHHVIVNCTIPFSRWIFRTELALSWEYGYIKYGSRNYGFVDSVGGLYYAAKYCTKDVYEDKYLRNLHVAFHLLGYSEDELKCFNPPMLVSNNYGLYALKVTPYDMLYKGSILMPDSVKSEKPYKLPLYYDRKLFYDVKYRYYDSHRCAYAYTSSKLLIPDGMEYSPIYVLNDDGLKMKCSRFPSYLVAARDAYRIAQLVDLLHSDIERINDKFKTCFRNEQDVKDFAFSLQEEKFIDYCLCYRGSVPSPFQFSSLHFKSTISEDFETSLAVKNGLTYDKPGMQSYLDNVIEINTISDIELKTSIIYYINSVARKRLEKEVISEELEYIDRKSEFLKRTEKYE